MPSKYDHFIVLLTFDGVLFLVVCSTCTTTDHGPAGHEYAPLSDAGRNKIRIPFRDLCSHSLSFLGSHQVAKLQNMVENTRQRLNDLKQSLKTTDRSYSLLQVKNRTHRLNNHMKSYFLDTIWKSTT